MGKHFDFGAVDWEGSGKAIIAATHEGLPGGHTLLSMDGGANWKELGTFDYALGPVGIVDNPGGAPVLMRCQAMMALLRSTDGGTTWSKLLVLPQCPRNPVIYVIKGVCYLMTEEGLMVSKDKGATWRVQGATVKASIGPFFGKDENHLVAAGPEGFYETKDGAKHWTLMAPLPPRLGPRDVTYAWDPIHNILYAAQHDKPAMKYVVGADEGQQK
jgi:photosystem II stability/assembly factor-like uncharacterized protein